jgi:hypothetical protein
VLLYELASSPDAPPVYVGQTRRSPRDRFSTHLHLARYRKGKNRRLEAWIRRCAERGDTIEIRIIASHPAGEEADTAERALIAKRRAELGPALLNLGPGGERAPAGRLVSAEERERARLARRARQRDAGYRRNQALACSRRRHAPEALEALLKDFATADAALTMVEICERHGLTQGTLLGILQERANGLVVDPGLVGAARAAQTRREALRAEEGARVAAAVAAALCAYLAAPPGTALAGIARDHGLDGRRLQEAVRRRQLGIPDELARAVRARMDEDGRLRARALGRRTARIDRQCLRWLLTAYARPGSRLTLAVIAARLGTTQPALSHIIGGRPGRPLPRRLLRACRARVRAVRLRTGRPGGAR